MALPKQCPAPRANAGNRATRFVALLKIPYRQPMRKLLLLAMLAAFPPVALSRALLSCSLNWEGGSREFSR
jgi:hypothetical protein